MKVARLRYLSWFIIAGVILHALLFTVLHLLVPEISPISGIISEYSNSPYHMLARTVYIIFGLIWAWVAIMLGTALPLKPLVAVGLGLLWLAALSLIVSAVFPQAADPRDPTQMGTVLIPIINVSRIGLFVAIILLSMHLRSAFPWQSVGNIFLILAVICIVTFLLTIGVLLKAGYGGLGQRLLFLLLYAWVLLVAYRVIVNPQEGWKGKSLASNSMEAMP